MKKMIIVSAILVAAPAFAQSGGSSSSQNQSYDPNETICRNVSDTGSRLARSRVCMTRAQWEQQRREMRQAVEAGQQRQVNPQPSG